MKAISLLSTPAESYFHKTIKLLIYKHLYENDYNQDKRIKELFPSSKRAYNKEKKSKYENHLKKLGKIAYDERFLNCNVNETFSKIYLNNL